MEQSGLNIIAFCVPLFRLGHKIFHCLCSNVTDELCYYSSHKIQNIITVQAWFGIWLLRFRYFGIRRCVVGLRASRLFEGITFFPDAGKNTKRHGVAKVQDLYRQYHRCEELKSCKLRVFSPRKFSLPFCYFFFLNYYLISFFITPFPSLSTLLTQWSSVAIILSLMWSVLLAVLVSWVEIKNSLFSCPQAPSRLLIPTSLHSTSFYFA